MGRQQRLSVDANRSTQRVSRRSHPLSRGRWVSGNTLGYTWTHPEDGAQEGLLAFGIAGSDNAIVALWADSWHQHPEAKVCEGNLDESGVISLDNEYGNGWRWQIVVDTSKTDVLFLWMHNVIPPEVATEEISAGPYVVMSMELHRTA
ncbi:MAG TPA: hypothetical protein VK754_05100 [Propionibacteriaceae bacterium]|nr:hypothetical protein [Propionibacteriaceae bacterium]